MAATSKTKKSSRNRRRVSAIPKDYWHQRARPLRFGGDRWRVTRLARGKELRVTDQVTAFNWDDTSAELSGSMTVQQTPVHLQVNQTHKFRVEWTPREAGAFEHLWTMKVASPDKGMVNDQWGLELSTSLSDVRKSRDNYRFKRDRAHPRGWTADQVARHVAAKVGLRLGRLAKCTHRITNLHKSDADPIDVITLAYRAERRATGRRFFLSWDGRLNIDALKRSEELLELSGAIIDASYKTEYADTFATVLTVRATTKARDDKTKSGAKRKTKHRRKTFHVRVTSPKGVREYGYVHRTVTAPDADTPAEARKYGAHLLAKNMRPKQTLTVTVPLMPTLRRGDAFKVEWREEGLTQVVFVSQASHSVSPGSETTQLTATFDDPFVDAQAERDKKRRAAKARKRRRPGSNDKAPTGGRSSRAQRRRTT